MLRFLIKRVLSLIVTLFAVSLVAFAIIQLPPGDFLTSYMTNLAAGGVTAARSYAPYGSPLNQSGTFGSRYGFAGEPVDTNGLSYNRARYYNPSIGSFVSLDPFEGFTSMPLSTNGYAYVMGNPINYTDPSGYFLNILAGAAMGAAFGAFLAGVQAAITYDLAVAGRCDCQRQKEALAIGRDQFILQAGAQALLFGAVIGAAVGAAGPAVATLAPVFTAFGMMQLLQLGVGIISDFLDNGRVDNECQSVDFMFALLDIAIDAGVDRLLKRPNLPDAPNTRARPDADLPTGARGGCSSFSADTSIALEDGQKPIAEVKMGDMIMGYSEGEDEVNVFHVTAVHAQEHATTLDLLIASETVHTTEEHPFFVKDKGWVDAGKLAVGDLVRRGDSSYGLVEVVLIVDAPQVMYNLSVSHVATYLVGEGRWVVHNDDRLTLNLIRYTQDSISMTGRYSYNDKSYFYNIFDNTKMLELLPGYDLPPIEIFEFTPRIRSSLDPSYYNARRGITGYTSNLEIGQVYTLDNRRPFSYRLAGRPDIPVEWVGLNRIEEDAWKFTTKNKGKGMSLELNLEQYDQYLKMCGRR